MKIKIILIKLIQAVIATAIFLLCVDGELIYIYSPALTTYNIVNTLVTYLAFLGYLIIDFVIMLKTAKANAEEKKCRSETLKKVSRICLALVFVVYIFTLFLARGKNSVIDKAS